MRKSIPLALLAVLLLGSVPAYADIMKYTFTMPGVSGTIGDISFSNAVVTVTAIGDTASRFENLGFPSNGHVYDVVASSLELNISGVGTATFSDPGAYGGQGFVFVVQDPLYIPVAYVGFGSNQGHGTIASSVLSTYGLTSPITVSGDYFINFDPAYYKQMTTLGLLTMLSSGEGTFTATLVPEPEPDTDGDGVPDDADQCPNSILAETVIIGSCDSGVPNPILTTGCTLSDLIAEAATSTNGQCEFVGAVAFITNGAMKSGAISGSQKGAIQSCAAKGRKP